MQPAVLTPLEPLLAIEELTTMYFDVCRCWNDHNRAVSEGMTSDRAIKVLCLVRDQAQIHKNGRKLSEKAAGMLWNVIYLQDDSI